MHHRLLGIALMALAAYVLWLAVPSAIDSSEATNVWGDLGSAFGVPINRDHFQQHWRISAILLSALALATLVAGAALVLLRRWGYLLLSITAMAALVIQGCAQLFGYAHYGFEFSTVTEAIALCSIAAVSYVAYRKRQVAAAGHNGA
jgi:fatty-acid desaturase